MIRLTLCFVILFCSACTSQMVPSTTSEAPYPSLERLYSLPNLLGTEPTGAVWSADSRKIAFLWNQDGLNFRDVWLAELGGPGPRRLTRLPRPATPSGTPGSPRLIRAQVDVERHRGATSLLWHPGGKGIFFSLDGELHLVDLDGTVQKVPGGESIRSLVFLGDGHGAAFQRGRDIWMAPIEDDGFSRARQLTRLEPGVSIERFSWSPRGTEILLVERDERHVPKRQIPDYLTEETTFQSVLRPLPGEPSAHRRLGIYTISSGRIRWLELGRSPEDILFSFSWSPDGSRIAVDTSDLYVKHRRILVIDAGSGRFETVYQEVEPDNVMAYWQMDWGSGGREIYFISDRDDFYHIYRIPSTGGEPAAVTSGEWAVQNFHLSAESVFFVANRKRPEERHIYRTDRDGGEPMLLSHSAGTHRPICSPDGSRALVHHSSDESPPDYLVPKQVHQC